MRIAELMASVPSQRGGVTKRVFVVLGGGILSLFITLSKILLATKIRQSGARKLAKLESACFV